MADELRVRAELKYTPSAANQVAVDTGLLKALVTMTGDDHSHGTQVIGTSEEALDIGADLGTVGYVLIKNLDATNFVTVGLTGSHPLKLKAQEFVVFRANGALYATANTAACKIQFWAFED